jgi:hypothetical protein
MNRIRKAFRNYSLIVFVLLGIFSPIVQAQSVGSSLELDGNQVNQLKAERQSNGVWQLVTSGKDPWIQLKPLTKALGNNDKVLSFEYFCPAGLDHFQVFFGPGFKSERSVTDQKIGFSEGWVSYSVDLSRDLKEWGKAGDFLRLDFGNKPDVQIQIKNLTICPMTEHEKLLAAGREEKFKEEAEMEAQLKSYLETNYTSEITEIEVSESKISVEGKITTSGPVYLCEIAPYQDVTEETAFETAILLKSKKFEQNLERFVNRNGINYDRILSKWVLAKKTEKGYELISHAHYPDQIKAKYDYPKEVVNGRKGIGGFSVNRGHLEDLDELDATSATVNIWFSKFMFSKAAPGRIEHVYNGKSYYFGEKQVAQFDSTFRVTARRGIVTAAILLVDKAESCPDPEIGRLLQHPDMDPSGIYSMPNMTNPASVDCYAAALDFLASRYSRPDKKYGRCNHWIMHNEVDAGWVWTNMGEKTDLIFMDTYIKSMRMCYAIARKYNPHSEVFVTLTHYWAWTSHPRFYPPKELMEILLQYTKTEGDFEWAMAKHPYPESLFEPKTWQDKKIDFTFNSPLITFANLEVLNAWIKLPEVLYKGKTKRTLWLSENGTNSRSYSEEHLKEQAAGFAYTWKKMKVLDGIDGFQWHNWFDNRGEGGLRIGLRRFPDDETDPGGAKPVWYVFKAADTENENAVFDQYKEMIGIKDWNEVQFKGEITEGKK